MKKIIILSTCFSLLAAGSFAQSKPAAKKASPQEDTIQYSLGVYMMQQLFAKTGFVVNDAKLFTQAINDVLANKKLMVDPATTHRPFIGLPAHIPAAKRYAVRKNAVR